MEENIAESLYAFFLRALREPEGAGPPAARAASSRHELACGNPRESRALLGTERHRDRRAKEIVGVGANLERWVGNPRDRRGGSDVAHDC